MNTTNTSLSLSFTLVTVTAAAVAAILAATTLSGCAAAEADDSTTEDAITVHAQRGSLCKADEKTVFACTRSMNGVEVQGYQLAGCAKGNEVVFRHGTSERSFAVPEQPSAAVTGAIATPRGSKGTYLEIDGASASVYFFDMGRTAPSSTGEEIGERWSGVSVVENGYLEAYFRCHADPTIAFRSSGAAPTRAPFDMSVLPKSDW